MVAVVFPCLDALMGSQLSLVNIRMAGGDTNDQYRLFGWWNQKGVFGSEEVRALNAGLPISRDLLGVGPRAEEGVQGLV